MCITDTASVFFENRTKRQLRNIRRKELRLASSIAKCPKCQANGIIVLSLKHPVIFKGTTFTDRLCDRHERARDKFNRLHASD